MLVGLVLLKVVVQASPWLVDDGLYVHMVSFLHVCLSPNVPFVKTQSYWIGAHPNDLTLI